MTGVPVAVLDLDGTLARGHAGAFLVEELLARRTGHAERGEAVLAALRSRSADVPYARTVETVYREFAAFLDGVPVLEVQEAADAAWVRFRRTVTPGLAPAVARLASGGTVLVLLSGSPDWLVDRCADELGVVHRYGAALRSRAGRCVGEYTTRPGLPGAKAELLARASGTIGDLDPAASLVVGNSTSDEELLAWCGHPVVVDGDAEAVAMARPRGWRVTTLGEVPRVLEGYAGILATARAGVTDVPGPCRGSYGWCTVRGPRACPARTATGLRAG